MISQSQPIPYPTDAGGIHGEIASEACRGALNTLWRRYCHFHPQSWRHWNSV